MASFLVQMNYSLVVLNRVVPGAATHLYSPQRYKHVTFSTTLHLTPSPAFMLRNTVPQIAM